MPIPLAYLLTWTTYGTWLHGDERGSVDDRHDQFGTPVAQKNSRWNALEHAALKQSPVVMNVAMRRVVRDAIIEHAPFRQAVLRALSVRTNHVHVVVRSATDDPADLTGRFKARATRALRDAGLAARGGVVWTAGESTRYLWDAASVEGAMKYVLFDQGSEDEFTVRVFSRVAGVRGGLDCPPASAGGSEGHS